MLASENSEGEEQEALTPMDRCCRNLIALPHTQQLDTEWQHRLGVSLVAALL